MSENLSAATPESEAAQSAIETSSKKEAGILDPGLIPGASGIEVSKGDVFQLKELKDAIDQ